jgi:hypothetical protein
MIFFKLLNSLQLAAGLKAEELSEINIDFEIP